MEKKLIKLSISIFCLFSSLSIFAQPGDTDGTPTDNLEGTDPPASINFYLLLLVFIGFLYAYHQFSKQKIKIKQ